MAKQYISIDCKWHNDIIECAKNYLSDSNKVSSFGITLDQINAITHFTTMYCVTCFGEYFIDFESTTDPKSEFRQERVMTMRAYWIHHDGSNNYTQDTSIHEQTDGPLEIERKVFAFLDQITD